MKSMKKIRVVILLLILLLGNCSKLTEPADPGAPYPNLLPETTLANIPPDNSTENPYFYRIKLSWDGGDNDGYIVGYRYKINDNDWIFTEATFHTFDFPSPDSLNLHSFQVKAVDDAGGEDPSPAVRRFYTKQTAYPETEIIDAPAEDKTVFIMPDTTRSWRGIEFILGGTDSDGAIVAYDYAIDDSTTWTTVMGSIIRIYGALADGEHRFYARAVDNARGVDPTPVKRRFSVIKPTLARQILIVDETRDGTGTAASPSDQMVDDFYRNLLVNYAYTEFDLKTAGTLDATTFANYDLVLWHDDERVEKLMKLYIGEIESYLQIGGKFLISGWRTMENVDGILAEEYIYAREDFAYSFLQLDVFKVAKERDFIAANGINGYPTLHTAAEKMVSSYEGKLNYAAVLSPFDRTNELLAFDSAIDDPSFEGKPCAVKFFSESYRAVVLGFPLYVMNEADSRQFMEKVIEELRN